MINYCKIHTIGFMVLLVIYSNALSAVQMGKQTEKLRLAILRIGYEDFTEAERKKVNQALFQHLEKDGRTEIVSEEEARSQLIPFGIEPNEISDVTGYVHAGQLLHADYVLVGNMDKIGDFVEVTFRIITMPKGMQLSYPTGKTFDILVNEEIPKIVDMIYNDINFQKQSENDRIDNESSAQRTKSKHSKLWLTVGGTVAGIIITGILLSPDDGNDQSNRTALPRPPSVP